jgi:hypothetical protein
MLFFSIIIATDEYVNKNETFEKCSILLKFKPPARGAYAPEGKAKILTTGIHLVF